VDMTGEFDCPSPGG